MVDAEFTPKPFSVTDIKDEIIIQSMGVDNVSSLIDKIKAKYL